MYLVLKATSWRGKTYAPGDIITETPNGFRMYIQKHGDKVVDGISEKALQALWDKKYSPKPKAKDIKPKDNK